MNHMRVLGLHIFTGELRFSVLKGTRAAPTLIDRGRLLTTQPDDVPALMDWYESQFQQLITTHKPEKLAYRLTLAPKKDQLFSSEFPLGVLNLLAHKKALPIAAYSAQSFKPSKLELAKNVDMYTYCDSVFGKNPPYWDKNQKHSLLVAWFEL